MGEGNVIGECSGDEARGGIVSGVCLPLCTLDGRGLLSRISDID